MAQCNPNNEEKTQDTRPHLIFWTEEEPFLKTNWKILAQYIDKIGEDFTRFQTVSLHQVDTGFTITTMNRIRSHTKPCIHVLLLGARQLSYLGLEQKEGDFLAEQIALQKLLYGAASRPDSGFLLVGALPMNEPIGGGRTLEELERYEKNSQLFNRMLYRITKEYQQGYELPPGLQSYSLPRAPRRWNCYYVDPSTIFCDPETGELARNVHKEDGVSLTRGSLSHMVAHLLVNAESLLRMMEQQKVIEATLGVDLHLPLLELKKQKQPSLPETVTEEGEGIDEVDLPIPKAPTTSEKSQEESEIYDPEKWKPLRIRLKEKYKGENCPMCSLDCEDMVSDWGSCNSSSDEGECSSSSEEEGECPPSPEKENKDGPETKP